MLLKTYFVLRSKSGIWGWRSDRTEVVNGFEAQSSEFQNKAVFVLWVMILFLAGFFSEQRERCDSHQDGAPHRRGEGQDKK
ncbi:hypothetical protein cypCar_00010124 [Cyprinus carpio]|nr:hypothetical protein cypCar_00010124 [Cyprinus carpio]